MRVAFHTFGCKVNQYDSESLAHLLRVRGHQIVSSVDEAELVIVNTCTVTKESERKARQWLRNVGTNHPDTVLAVMGCYAQTSPEELTRLPGVRFVTGVKDRESLVEWMESAVEDARPRLNVEEWSEEETLSWHEADFPFRTRAYLKIEDGCSSHCSYCKIPSARGPVRSLALERVVEAFRRLIDQGHAEVVLTGIHLGCYGQDLGIGLHDVVHRVDEVSGDYRFRLSSVEPTDLTPDLITTLVSAQHLCPHLHIPLQSGSNTVLARMNRKYTVEEYQRLIQTLRRQIPELCITTDLIVGFPGESEDEFKETYEFVESIGFGGLHVFPFSRREGTPAYDLPERVSRQVKRERVKKLIRLGDAMRNAFAQRFLGRTVSILVEEMVEPDAGEGFSEHYIRGLVHGIKEPGQLIKATVRRIEPGGTFEAFAVE